MVNYIQNDRKILTKYYNKQIEKKRQMNELQEIPSTISIQQVHENSGYIPSSVIQLSSKSIRNNDTVIFHSFIKQNQMDLAKNQQSILKVDAMINKDNHHQLSKKCFKTELKGPQNFNELKLIAKYSAVVESDSQNQSQSDSQVQDFIEQKSHLSESDQRSKRKNLRPLKENSIVDKRAKIHANITKQDQKIHHLSLTAASQSGNLCKKADKENIKNILFREISRNKFLQDELTRVKQENNQLRTLISEIGNKKLTTQTQKQDFILKCKMKQVSKKGNKNLSSLDKKLKSCKDFQNLKNRRINTEGNLIKSQIRRIQKIQKKMNKFQQVLNNLHTKTNKNAKQTKQKKLMKKNRLKTQNKQIYSKFQ